MKQFKIVGNDLSDGFHTFDELYDHRCLLFLNLCMRDMTQVHYEDAYEGWFLLSWLSSEGQISYHMPDKFLPIVEKNFTKLRPYAWDGHTPDEVAARLLAMAVKEGRDERAMSLREIIGQAIGEASMCWQPRPDDAVFCSEEAGRILDRVMAIVDERMAAKDAQLTALQKELDEQCRLNGLGAQRELKLMTQLAEARKVLIRYREMTRPIPEYDAFLSAHPEKEKK